MAGSNTVTVSDKGGNISEYSMAWTSDGSGNVSGNTFGIKRGILVAVEYDPDGTDAPTANYDVTLNVTDTTGADLLGGTGSNLSATATTRSTPLVNTSGEIYFEGGTVDLVVANGGAAKKGVVKLWVLG